MFEIAIMAALSAPVPAVLSQDAQSPLLIKALDDCLAVKEDSVRLACLERASRTLIAATRTREVVIVDREEMKKTRRSLFGFALPRINLFGRNGPDEDPEEVKRVETTIKQVGRTGYDRYVITTEDGARWTTTEGWSGQLLPTAGKKVTIKRGAIGSYMLEMEGGRAIRAMRTG